MFYLSFSPGLRRSEKRGSPQATRIFPVVRQYGRIGTVASFIRHSGHSGLSNKPVLQTSVEEDILKCAADVYQVDWHQLDILPSLSCQRPHQVFTSGQL